MITVTLQQIKRVNPCLIGWKKVLKANDADMNKPFPLISILDSNNLDDLLWVVSNVPELSEYDEVWREFACWCALQNVEKIKECCSNEDYSLIVKWLETNDLSLRESVWSLAWSLAGHAAKFVNYFAARSAIEAIGRSTAEDARYAANSISRFRIGATNIESRFVQAEKLRELMGEKK